MLIPLLLLLMCFQHAVTKKCSPFPHAILENGHVSVLGDQKFLFQCDSGFFLASPPLVRCWKGKWSSTKTPKCIKSEGMCEEPTAISNGEIHGSERSVGSTVQYMCQPGFLLLGEGSRECLPGGHWSGITPACMEESEPIQKVADRLKEHFVSNLSTSNESIPQGRLLDSNSLHHGLELVILIDRSSSIDPEDFETAINFVKFLMQEFGVRNGNTSISGTRVAILTFGSKVDLLFNLDNSSITGPIAAYEALDTVQDGGGGTALEAALTSVFTLLSPLREKAKKAIFLMTDGEPNIGTPGITPEDVAIQLKDAGGFEIFTMGVGRGINRKLLSSLASQPLLSHVFILDKYSDLRSIMKAITDTPIKGGGVISSCGYIKDSSFHLKKWPWMAAIYVGSSPELRFCTGTLICSDWILTSASCFNRTLTEEPVFIVFGENNIVQDEKHQMNFYATRVVLHPNYSPLDPVHDNLALLQLNSPIPLKRFRPVCLPPTGKTVPLHMDLNINASIAGWSLPPQLDSNGHIDGSTHLFNRVTVTVELAEQHECRRIVGRAFSENLFCAGFGKKVCAGDPGSPVIVVDPSTQLHHIIGVLDGREKCAELGLNYYTELTGYIPWIDDVIDRCHSKHIHL
ncbi:complement C2 isoform X2 [Parasteatoda tepidariorum]|uniref:complement C2 isoform X2 n=1 Tax=Parasteatoda tepidariorum TaxID=114398 RepID=UPI0039BD3A3E